MTRASSVIPPTMPPTMAPTGVLRASAPETVVDGARNVFVAAESDDSAPVTVVVAAESDDKSGKET